MDQVKSNAAKPQAIVELEDYVQGRTHPTPKEAIALIRNARLTISRQLEESSREFEQDWKRIDALIKQVSDAG